MEQQPLARPSYKINWILLLQISGILAAVVALFYPSISALFSRWVRWDEDLSHAIPTLFVFLFLIARTDTVPYRKNSFFIQLLLLAVIAALSILWFFFIKTNIALLAFFAILFCLPTIVASSYSLRTAVYLLPSFGILLFTLPVFSQVNDLLVNASAFVVGNLVHAVGITALIDGQNIYLSSGHIFIAGGCSGLRYLTISILLGYLLAILNHYSIKRTLLTIGIAIVLALLTNWLRIFSLVIIGDLTAMKSSLMHDHEMFGWLLFAVIMFPAIFFAPVFPKPSVQFDSTAPFSPRLALLTLMIGPVLFLLSKDSGGNVQLQNLNALNNITTIAKPKAAFQAKYPAKPLLEFATAKIDDINVEIGLAQYPQINSRDKLIPYFESLYNPEEWHKVTALESATLSHSHFKALVLKRVNEPLYQLFIYRYEIGKYSTANYEMAKLLQLPAALFNYHYFNIITFTSSCNDEQCTKELAAASTVADEWAKKK